MIYLVEDGACCCIKNVMKSGRNRRPSWLYQPKDIIRTSTYLSLLHNNIEGTHYTVVQLSTLQREMIVMATNNTLIILLLSIDNKKYVTLHNFQLTECAFSHLLTWYNTPVYQNVRGHYLKYSGSQESFLFLWAVHEVSF